MPRELLMMQNSFQWGTAEGQTLEIENAIRSNVRDLKIEGQTYQDVFVNRPNSGDNPDYTFKPDGVTFVLKGVNSNRHFNVKDKSSYMLKTSTYYTYVVNIIRNNNTDEVSLYFNTSYQNDISYFTASHTVNVPKGFTGTLKFLTETKTDFSSVTLSDRNYLGTNGKTLDVDIKFNYYILEGNYTNIDLPTSINGIESVAEREFEQNLYTEGDLNVKGKVAWYNVKKYVAVKPNTNYTFSCNIESVNKGDYNAKPFIEIYTNEKLPSNRNINLSESGSASFTTNNEAKQLIIYFFANNEKYSSTECEANFKNIELYESVSYPVKLTNRGKNLLDLSTFIPVSDHVTKTSINGNIITVRGLTLGSVEAYTDLKANNLKVYLEEGKTYSFSFKSDAQFGGTAGTDTVEIFFMLEGTLKNYFNVLGQRTVTIPAECSGDYYIRFDVNSGDKTHTFYDIQVEEGDNVTDYEPYREPTFTEIPLPQPLRSLPNGVCDELVGNKLIQRVGVQRLDGTEVWEKNDNIFFNNISEINKNCVDTNINLINQISNVKIISWSSMDNHEDFGIHYYYFLRLNLKEVNAAAGATVDDLKTYLSRNPIYLYYELATPIEHTINVPRIPIAKGSNTITTTNNIKPNLSIKYKKAKRKKPTPKPPTTTYLYNAGNGYLNITGGWNTQLTANYGAATTIVKNANNIYFPSGTWNMLLTNNKIDVTNYDRLYMKYSKEYSPFNYHPARCAIKLGNKNTSWTDFADDGAAAPLIAIDETENNVTNGILTIDVTNITGSYYVGIGGQSNKITVHEVWLENGDTTNLYFNGNENISFTGGYLTGTNNSASCNIEKQVDNLYVNCTGKGNFDSICYARTNKTIKPCKLKVNVKMNSITSGTAFCMFLSQKETISSVSDFNSVQNKRYIKADNTTQGQYVDLEIDLTDNAEGYFYILCMVAGSTSYTCKANINKIEIIR